MISIIAAVSANGVLGFQGKIPWKIKEDFAFFKKMTLNTCVIMGRATFESMGSKPLKDRVNIVVSSKLAEGPGYTVVSTLDEALARAKDLGLDVFLIGGSSIYQQGLEIADRVYITDVNVVVKGDAFFPYLSTNLWRKVWESDTSKNDSGVSFKFNGYERVGSYEKD